MQPLLVATVVEIVSVAEPPDAPVIMTGVVEPKLKDGKFCAPAGLRAMAAVSAMLPLKPPPGVKVIVEVFAAVAPGVTVTAVPLIAKLGLTAAVTVTEVVPVALL
jgi:hypothetical protein